MFSSLDNKGQLIDIDTAIKCPTEKYFCCSCNGELIVKNGDVRVPHFAHISKYNCDDYDNDMSEWHRNWQKRFPLKNREVILKIDKDFQHGLLFDKYCSKRLIHRADVLCYGYVLEFQNSPITSEEFEARNYFYTLLEYKVVWIFNMIELKKNGKINYLDEWIDKNDNGAKYSWMYASKTFTGYKSYDKNIILIFQLAEEPVPNNKKEEYSYLERVTWAINSNNEDEGTDFKRFFTSYYPSNFEELMEKLRKKVL